MSSNGYDKWRDLYKGKFKPFTFREVKMTDWAAEREDVLRRFAEELEVMAVRNGKLARSRHGMLIRHMSRKSSAI